MSNAENEHFVPRFLLKRFKDADGQLYYLNNQNLNIGHCSLDKACSQKDIYEIKRDFGNGEEYLMRGDTENKLSVREKKYSSLCKKIVSVCENPNNKFALVLDEKEKEMLFEFIINLHFRNPNRLLDYKNETCFLLKNNDEFFKEFEILKNRHPNEIITKLTDGAIEHCITQAMVLPSEYGNNYFDLYKHIFLSKGSFCFLKSNNNDFIISDNTASISKDGYMFVSISPRYAVVVSLNNYFESKHQQNRLGFFGSDDELEIAKIIYQESKRYIYGRKKTLEKIKGRIKGEQIL